MSAAVVVPWRSHAARTARARVLPQVLEHVHKAGLPVLLADPPVDPQDWSPGRARNYGVTLLADRFEVVVFNDADTICPVEQLLEAATLAAESPGLVYAYTLYVRRGPSGRPEPPIFNAPSMGCAAVSTDTLWRVGGFDEGFVGWGYEDVAFARSCGELEPIRRVDGPCYHLWHGARAGDDSPLDADPAQVARNRERLRVVEAAR